MAGFLAQSRLLEYLFLIRFELHQKKESKMENKRFHQRQNILGFERSEYGS